MIASISLPISIADQASFARGFAWASQNKIDVISCSWRCNTPSDIITEAIKQAATKGRNGKGCTIAFATGNENLGQISYPSSLDEVFMRIVEMNRDVENADVMVQEAVLQEKHKELHLCRICGTRVAEKGILNN